MSGLKKYLVVGILYLIASQLIIAQNVRETLFTELDGLIEQARAVNASLLSPSHYETGMEYYSDADELFKSGDNIDEIRENVERAIESLKKAIEVSELAQEMFGDLIKARSDAQAVHAPEVAPDLWEYGVESFLSATEEFEGGYVSDAQELAKESENYFRDAELKAIKQKMLGPTWDLLADAEELSVIDFAPVTLSKSKLLIQQAESELTDVRYNNTHAEELIAEAFYEAKHAIYITKLFVEMNEKDKSWEDIKLASEEPIKEIANNFGLVAQFDNGYDEPKQKIINYVKEFSSEIKTLNEEIASLKEGNEELKGKFSECEERISLISSEKEQLEMKLAAIEKEEAEFQSVREMYSISEAEVLKDGENVVIRLTSLNFDAGKAVINPQYFSLLSKVQKTILLFPECTVSVEGHTDSQGNEDANLTLSQERADAVRQYLLANLELNSNRILAIGYGEKKPVANNETEEGRRENRRIDIVINPNPAY
ncbi:OmpA family protein [Bacteroidota bacterium]